MKKNQKQQQQHHHPAVSAQTAAAASASSSVGCCDDGAKVVIVGDRFSQHDAHDKLYQLSRMPHVQKVFGMPDLHMALPCPVGTSVHVTNHIYPKLIGDDIGCGVSFFRLRETVADIPDAETLANLLQTKFADTRVSHARLQELRASFGFHEDTYDEHLGSIGGGNHFAELQRIDQLFDPEFASLLPTNRLYMCTHSGSREYGVQIQRDTPDGCFNTTCKEFQTFMKKHDDALLWSKCSRRLIAERFCTASSSAVHIDEPLFDVVHNFIERSTPTMFVHRKGAIPSQHGPAMIPGSRGAYSYLVRVDPTKCQDDVKETLPHGAGRILTRSQAKEIFKDETQHTMQKTDVGSFVVCDSESLMRQEHPQVYKNIDDIMDVLQTEYGVTVIARFVPIITVKM